MEILGIWFLNIFLNKYKEAVGKYWKILENVGNFWEIFPQNRPAIKSQVEVFPTTRIVIFGKIPLKS